MQLADRRSVFPLFSGIIHRICTD
uniref:Uncharacterized protein n=1 Tax=Anguilla anguilla TaxID=7936 RepID=A0A0E9XQV4_ANGAN